MWSQGTRQRGQRAIRALAEASSIGALVLVLVPMLAPFAASAIAFSLGHEWIGSFAAGAVSMFVLLVLVIAFPLHQALRRIFYGFRLCHVEIAMSLDDQAPKVHRRTAVFQPRIVRTGERHIPDRYCAPGPRSALQSQVGTPSSKPAHSPRVVRGNAQILGPLYDSADDCWNYQMDLGASLASGIVREIRLEQTLDYRSEDYEPRLQRTILDPTDHLTLRLKIPRERWPIDAEGEELLSGNRPRKLKVNTDEEHGEVVLEVKKPRFGRIYRIRWTSTEAGLGREGAVGERQELGSHGLPTRAAPVKQSVV